MNITQSPLRSLQFGERYKSTARKVEEAVVGSGIAAGSVGAAGLGTLTGLQPYFAEFPILCVAGHVSMLGGGSGASSVVTGGSACVDAASTNRKPSEPAVEKPEAVLRKAMEQLDQEREKHRNSALAIKNMVSDQKIRLQEMRDKAKLLVEEGRCNGLSQTAYELAVAETNQEIANQEKTLADMRKNLTLLEPVERQFSEKIEAQKKKYLGLMNQLQQIEQNRKLLEMQKSMESLKTENNLGNPALDKLQNQLEEELHKSNAEIERFLDEAQALTAQQTQPQSTLIDALREPQK